MGGLMSVITRKDEQTGTEISINYEIIGDGRETIVFHHGNGNCSKDWHTLGFVNELKNDFRLVLIDSRGYGNSSKPHDPQEYNLNSRANDTIAVLDKEEIEQAHCLGGSIGAMTCMILARFYPSRFKSYIFATPYFSLFDDDSKNFLKGGVENYLAMLKERHNVVIDNEEIKATFLANDAEAIIAANSSEWFAYQDYIKYINVPSLIYAGSEEPSIPALQQLSEKLTESSGYKCHLHIFPGVDHKQVYWGSKMVCPLLREFLNSNFPS